MKLVELLAKRLDKWPARARGFTQDANRKVYPCTGLKVEYNGSVWTSQGLYTLKHIFTAPLASDHDTAIVTRTDWSAERARIAKPAKKSDKDGWVRHRGGKAPVSDDVFIDVRYRDGEILECQKFEKSEAYLWTHGGACGDIMAYKLHKPAEQVEACSKPDPRDSAKRDSDYVCWMRDRITEIDATTQALTTERAELVQKLASEGFALIGRAVEPVEDVSLRNIKAGDTVVYVKESNGDFTNGRKYSVLSVDSSFAPYNVIDDEGDENCLSVEECAFHSRPSA